MYDITVIGRPIVSVLQPSFFPQNSTDLGGKIPTVGEGRPKSHFYIGHCNFLIKPTALLLVYVLVKFVTGISLSTINNDE